MPWKFVVGGCACLCLLSACSDAENQKRYGHSEARRSVRHVALVSDKNDVLKTIDFHNDGSLAFIAPDGKPLVTLDYECADTPEKRALGLMYRQKLGELQSMLFLYGDEAPRYMYMKNTYISLDIIFFDKEKRVVKIHHNAKPRSEELLPSGRRAMFALEVNAGFCKRYGIQEGALLQF